MHNNEQIMEILDRLPKEQELSYSEIARRVNMGRTAIHRYFTREREFPLNKTADFAEAFGVEPEYLLGFTKNGKLQSMFSKLNNKNREKAYKYIEMLYENQELED